MEIVCTGAVACNDRRAKYRNLVKSAGKAKQRELEVIQAKLHCKQARLEALKHQSALEQARGCEVCSRLQAQAFGQGVETWYKRRCSKCWQEHAQQHTQKVQWLQEGQSKYRQDRQTRECANNNLQCDASGLQDSALHSSSTQHPTAHHGGDAVHCSQTAYMQMPSYAADNSQLINALDLAAEAATQPVHRQLQLPLQRPGNSTGRQHKLRCQQRYVHNSRSDKHRVPQQCVPNETRRQPAQQHCAAANACQPCPAAEAAGPASPSQSSSLNPNDVCTSSTSINFHSAAGGCRSTACSRSSRKDAWEAAAAAAIAQQLAAIGLPATGLASNQGPAQATEIMTVMAAAGPAITEQRLLPAHTISTGSRKQSAQPFLPCDPAADQPTPLLVTATQPVLSNTCNFRSGVNADRNALKPAGQAATFCTHSTCVAEVDSYSSGSPGSLPSWQRKLMELEAACKQAEQLMVHGAALAERKAALELAAELREDIARIRQANRVQLKLQRTLQLKQGVAPAAAFGSTVSVRLAPNAPSTATSVLQAGLTGGDTADKAPLQLVVLDRDPRSAGLGALDPAYEACKLLPAKVWRQRRKQEAAWQTALKQQLAHLQTEDSSGGL